MENQKQENFLEMPLDENVFIHPEEPTQEAQPWQDRFYAALLQAFPQPLFHRFQKEGLKDIVSWTSDGYRFFFSWHSLDKDELMFENDSQVDSTD